MRTRIVLASDRIATAGVVLGLATGASYGMILAVTTRNWIPLLLTPTGLLIGLYMGRKRERQQLMRGIQDLLHTHASPESD